MSVNVPPNTRILHMANLNLARRYVPDKIIAAYTVSYRWQWFHNVLATTTKVCPVAHIARC